MDKQIHIDFINKSKEMSSKSIKLQINISGETENGQIFLEILQRRINNTFFI